MPAAQAYIEIEDETLLWRTRAGFTLDVAKFDSTIAEAASGDEAMALAALEKAIALYQGDLLPGCYDDWIAPLRTWLRLSYAEALERLIQLYTARNEYTLAFQAAERWRLHDPLQETVYVHLLRLALVSGDHARRPPHLSGSRWPVATRIGRCAWAGTV